MVVLLRIVLKCGLWIVSIYVQRTINRENVLRQIISYIHWTIQPLSSTHPNSFHLGTPPPPQKGGVDSRVMIQDGPMQYLHSSARRLYRIFIHAYEHHNEMFRAFEVSPPPLPSRTLPYLTTERNWNVHIIPRSRRAVYSLRNSRGGLTIVDTALYQEN